MSSPTSARAPSIPSGTAAQHPASLPVPDLSLTLQRYLVSIAPLVTTEAFKQSAVRCLRLLENSCEHGKITGPRLQDMLVQKAASKEREGKSWLIDDWVRIMYTTWRQPLPCNVSYWYLVSDKVFTGIDAIAAGDVLAAKSSYRAAALILRAAQFRDLIFHKLVPAEILEGCALDSRMYRYIFHTCRMPRKHEDGVRVYDGEAATAPLEAVVVLRKGQLFVVSMHSALVPGCRASLQELARRIDLVGNCADAETNAPSKSQVPNLTAGQRDTWAQAFPLVFGAGAAIRPSHHVTVVADPALEMVESADTTERHNTACLQTIESSLCVLCLDDHCADTVDERSRNLLDGHTSNRWFDKTAQFVIADDGAAGFIGEHSYCDGMPTAVALAWMTARIQGHPDIAAQPNEYMQEAERGIPAGSRIIPTCGEGFARLSIRVPACADSLISASISEIQAQRDNHESFAMRWSAYGREAIKKAGVSPDAWAQMAIQLAYLRWQGKFVPTYEPAHTRRFLWGRTACIRVVSAASCKWAAAMRLWPDIPAAEKPGMHGLLQAAGKVHAHNSRLAAAGQDVDRHLLGLKILAREKAEDCSSAVADFWTDPSLAATSTWFISTSNLTVDAFDNWGWGEVVEGGIGVAYGVHANAIQLNIVAEKKMEVAGFVRELSRALRDMMQAASAP